MPEMSALPIDRNEFKNYTEEELINHYQTFCAYDLDSNGFITPDNLLDVLTAMEVKDASAEMVKNIIEEVAVLSGQDNDGKLSFKDYMLCLQCDHEAADHNLALDAVIELRLSQCDEEESLRESAREEGADAPEPTPEPEPEPEPEPQPRSRMRQSSMSAVTAVAASRIRAFQQQADETQAKEKLNAFKSLVKVPSGPIVNSDEMHKETLRNKVKAFETAAKYKDRVELKKTWRQVGSSSSTGNYHAANRLVLAGKPVGPPPKKKITDLP